MYLDIFIYSMFYFYKPQIGVHYYGKEEYKNDTKETEPGTR